MSVAGFAPEVVDNFGSLVTYTDPTVLPVGVSPDNQDVQFILDGVKTRDGLLNRITLAGPNACRGISSHITPQQALRTIISDAGSGAGTSAFVYVENVPTGAGVGALTQLTSQLNPGAYMSAAGAFGRQYCAFGDGQAGLDMPMQYVDQGASAPQWDRVSQDGPGASPSVADEVLVYNITGSPNGILPAATSTIAGSPNGLIEAGNLVTITITGGTLPAQLQAGDSVTIAGAGVATYNGTWVVAAVLSTTQFTFIMPTTGVAASGAGTVTFPFFQVVPTVASILFPVGLSVTIAGAGVAAYNATWAIRSLDGSGKFTVNGSAATIGTATSGGGTVTAAGNVAAGLHNVSVIFVTRQGYLTRPAPPGSWTAGGGKRAIVSNIPVGPTNVVQRIVCFSGVGGADYYYVPSLNPQLFSGGMVINDNTSTTLTVDFSDAVLLSGNKVSSRFNQVTLGECAGVLAYANRLFWWRERNKLNNVLNLMFDGGWSLGSGQGGEDVPLGWKDGGPFASGGGGSRDQAVTIWGDAYRITGDGATARRGLVSQGVYKDYLGVPILQANTAYSIRARVAKSAGGVLAGNLVFVLRVNGVDNKFSVTPLQVGVNFIEFIGSILPAQANIDSAAVFYIYGGEVGTPIGNGAAYTVDNIEIFPTLTPVNDFWRVSNINDPEAYDGVTGILQPAASDGTVNRTGFVLRDILYMVKDRSFYSTQQTAGSEPSGWTINEVSRSVGTVSVQGVDVADDFAVIAGRDGIYRFNGGEPVKFSDEIQPTWDSINEQFGYTLWVRVDQQTKRVLIGVPLGAATAPGSVLYLDYRDGWDPPVHITFTGKLRAYAKTRRWSQWTISAAVCSRTERGDGTREIWLGANDAANIGKVRALRSAQLTDDGAFIPAYYTTAFLSGSEIGQVLPAGRQLLGYLGINAWGAGKLLMSAFAVDLKRKITLRVAGFPLASAAPHDIEVTTRIYGERFALRFEPVNSAGNWFAVGKVTAWLKQAPYAVVRGGV
jgi:hypothetical protein